MKRAAALLQKDPSLPVSHALLGAGYAPNVARKPQDVTGTKGWQELMAKYLPDESLLAVHDQLLNKKDSDGTPDTQAASKALDMAYKIKGRYKETVVVENEGYEGLIARLSGSGN